LISWDHYNTGIWVEKLRNHMSIIHKGTFLSCDVSYETYCTTFCSHVDILIFDKFDNTRTAVHQYDTECPATSHIRYVSSWKITFNSLLTLPIWYCFTQYNSVLLTQTASSSSNNVKYNDKGWLPKHSIWPTIHIDLSLVQFHGLCVWYRSME